MSEGRCPLQLMLDLLLLFLATVTLELEGPSRPEREVGHDARRGCPESTLGPSWRFRFHQHFNI